MGILNKPYELSIWEDKWDSEQSKFIEVKLLILGSNTMTSSSRALSPKLVENVNGSHTLTFMIYYQYKDSATGQTIQNPYAPYLTNERKLKLKYGHEWYDLIIKNVKIDSTKYTYDITATDLYINELSKNGFNLTFDAELNNNVGTVLELAKRALASTDWNVPTLSDNQGSEFIPDKAIETLVKLEVGASPIMATLILDVITGQQPILVNNIEISAESTIYAFYSCLVDKAKRFLFIYIPDGEDIYKDDTRVITNKNCQYFVDIEPSTYSTSVYGLFVPTICNNDSTKIEFSTLYRGARYNFSPTSVYNSVLGQYAQIYRSKKTNTYPIHRANTKYTYGLRVKRSGNYYSCIVAESHTSWQESDWELISTASARPLYGMTTTEIKPPNLITNWVTNPSDFKSTSGWHAGIMCDAYEVGAVYGKDDCVYYQNKYYLCLVAEDSESSDTWVPSEWLEITRDLAHGTILNTAVRPNTSTTLLQDLRNGTFASYVANGGEYAPILQYTAPSHNILKNYAGLINTGLYDKRINLKNLYNRLLFVCRVKGTNLAGATILLGAGIVDNDCYLFSDILAVEDLSSLMDTHDYYTCILTISDSDFTEETFKRQILKRAYIMLLGSNNMQIENFELFEYVPHNDGYLTPEDLLIDTETLVTYTLYDKYTIDHLGASDKLSSVAFEYRDSVDPVTLTNTYTLPLSCEKRRSVTAKESNYFNIIQTLCETFECWADFIIEHDNDGRILSKTLIFKNYIGNHNYAGFRYGVNLKSISRTDDSKSIVTKLIVKQNSNEFGTNGFCTIARAPSNETRENYIYNFDHYINQGLLSAKDWNDYIYCNGTTSGGNPCGYYTKLSQYNKSLLSLNNIATKQAIVLAQAKATLTAAEAGYAAAVDEYEAACDTFLLFAGCEYDEYRTKGANIISLVEDSKNIHYLIACGEAYQAKHDYAQKVLAALQNYTKLENEYNALYTKNDTWLGINALIQAKDELNTEFYSKFSRFIQEGVWNNEEYYSDEQYYLDALSTLYTSSVPKVTYSISVLELSQLLGYEQFTFNIGDRTYIEDPEFFGYDNTGAPIREEVILNEITYNLDEPSKNTIKVSNFKTQFQDLFKRIAATVQSVQFSTGSYEKAAALVNADDTEKSTFLQGALNDSSTVIQNLAELTVRLDAEGLTITDSAEANRSLRAVSGGILLTEDGGETWDVGITAKGINAKILTTGTLNTGEVNIMYGAEPTFRWDAYGITAYEFNTPSTPKVDTGVRFDRLGIYGFTGAPGDWHPSGIVEWYWDSSSPTNPPVPRNSADHIRRYSTFELTKEGLYLNLGKGKNTYGYIRKKIEDPSTHAISYEYAEVVNQEGQHTTHNHQTVASLGKIEDIIYNTWDKNMPIYDASKSGGTFVKVMAVGQRTDAVNAAAAEQDNFAIYDDGTVRARTLFVAEGIQADDGSGLNKIAYSASSDLPTSSWSALQDETGTWHKSRLTTDKYMATTMDNGVTWQGPMLLKGSSVTGVANDALYIYYRSNIAPTTTPDIWVDSDYTGTWTTENISATSSALCVYRARLTRIKVTNDGSSTLPSDVKCTIPELYKMWHDNSNIVDLEAYAAFYRATNNGRTDALYFAQDPDSVDPNEPAKLYINATEIKTGSLDASVIATTELNASNITTGTLTVGSIFSATINGTPAVHIGKFIVNEYGLIGQYGTTGNERYVGIRLNDTGIEVTNADVSTNKVLFAGATDNIGSGANFYVRNDGYLYSLSGLIGGCDIVNGTLQIDAANIKSGTIDSARIPDLSADKITTGTLSADRIDAHSIAIGKLSGSITNDGWGIDFTSGTFTIGSITASSLTVTGKFHASSDGVYIGSTTGSSGFTVKSGYLTSYSYKTTYNDSTYDGVFIGSAGIGLGKGKFTVSNAGYLTATSGKIAGWTIDTNGLQFTAPSTVQGATLLNISPSSGDPYFKINDGGVVFINNGSINDGLIQSLSSLNIATTDLIVTGRLYFGSQSVFLRSGSSDTNISASITRSYNTVTITLTRTYTGYITVYFKTALGGGLVESKKIYFNNASSKTVTLVERNTLTDCGITNTMGKSGTIPLTNTTLVYSGILKPFSNQDCVYGAVFN